MMVFDGLIDATSPREPLRPKGDDASAAPFYVRVYEGRWIVDCLDCNGAEFANPHDRWFWCSNCGNIATQQMRRPVLWPDNPAAIAAELKARPRENRNWYPEVTVEQLRAENIEHIEELRAQRDRLTAEIRKRERSGN